MADTSHTAALKPKHVRAARALLAWSQQDLAKASGVATSTVADFERGQRTPVANNAQAMRSALEGAGVRFLPTGAVIGPPIRGMASSERPGAPIRWVSAEDLSDWANRMDGVISLPTLLAYLIRATHGPSIYLRFPSDEGVRHAGWDGRTSADVGSKYVPLGEAGWEIGCQREGIAQKASEDHRKRTKKPAQLDPADAAYVFVTPRHWPKKDEWAKARQAEGVWREVRAYDADDLVHWIEQTPAIGLWLATRLGKRPAGVRQLEDIWQEWSLATKWPLTEELVLSDRDEDATEVLRWLRGEPSVLSLQTTTSEEGVAFFHATLSMLPDEVAETYRALTLVATTTAGARALANAPAPLILVLTEADPGLARVLVERGHYVLQSYDDRPVSRGEVRRLARPSLEGIASALAEAGIAKPRAEALARDSARNLAVLRRLIPSAPERLPDWAQEPPPRVLLAALLAGGWDDDVEGDRIQVAELAAQPYEDVVAALVPYVGDLDRPLRKVGSTWRVASPSDAWFLLARYLTAADLTRFESAAHTVLGSADPRFEMNPDERWMASVKGIHRDHSGLLRHGIGEVLILLALWGAEVRTVPDAARRADALVGKLLRNADGRRWWSLSRDFRLLAEASPGAFLAAIEDSLDQNDPPIRALFGTEKGGVFETEHLSDLLWALESLAWSPDLMPRVTHVLARLDAVDTFPGRSANRPSNSLRDIHLLWNPQTFATLDERLRALDLIRKREPDAAWKLMLHVLPQGHDICIPSPKPRWRDFVANTAEDVTWGLIGRGAAALSQRLLADVGVNAARWKLLLEKFADLAPDSEAGLAALTQAESALRDEAERVALWTALRHLLHHHRQFPEAEWSMPAETLDRLEAVYNRFAPADPLARMAFLFEECVELPDPPSEGWQATDRDVDAARRKALENLFSQRGVAGILALARLVGVAGYVGKALYDDGMPRSDLDAVVEASLRSDHPGERGVAHGLIVSIVGEWREPWAEALLAKAQANGWGDTAVLTILRALPIRRWTWDKATDAGAEIEANYWRSVPMFWMREDTGTIAFAIRKLISAGRARHALALARRGDKVELPSDLLVEMLREAARQPFEGDDANQATMFGHDVAEIFELLDERNDVGQNTLVELEWAFLPVFEHSQRPAKALMRALSEEPSVFIQMLCALYKPSEESGIVEPEPDDPEHARRIATRAYDLLKLWNRLPGTRADGTVDGGVLETWVKEARSRAKLAGREDAADHVIGTMLSAAPIGADGNWPAEAVRDAIDLFRSKSMIESFWVGKSNRRGVTTRGPRDGGGLERQEAAKYRNWAKAMSFDHPHTAKALDTLAESYEDHAIRQDERAERLDWEF